MKVNVGRAKTWFLCCSSRDIIDNEITRDEQAGEATDTN